MSQLDKLLHVLKPKKTSGEKYDSATTLKSGEGKKNPFCISWPRAKTPTMSEKRKF